MSKFSLLIILVCFSACSPISPLLSTAPSQSLNPSLSSSLLPESVQAFVLQKTKEKGGSASFQKAFNWYQSPPLSGFNKSPDLTIQDVLFNGQSIQGSQAPSSLKPEWEGDPLELRIIGQFENKREKDLNLRAFLFTLDPSVLLRSMAPNETEPVARVLLNDAILLTPVSVSGSEIRVKLPQEGMPDLFLKGLHKLTLIKNRFYFNTQIKVGEPLIAPPEGSLEPQIQHIEVVRNNKGQPRFLRCIGSGIMIGPKFSYAQLDGDFAFGYQSQMISSKTGKISETLIHIPDPTSFELNVRHTLSYSTPFGSNFKQF